MARNNNRSPKELIAYHKGRVTTLHLKNKTLRKKITAILKRETVKRKELRKKLAFRYSLKAENLSEKLRTRFDLKGKDTFLEMAERGKAIEKLRKLILGCEGLIQPELFSKLNSIFIDYESRCTMKGPSEPGRVGKGMEAKKE
jgi:hypothetical protein